MTTGDITNRELLAEITRQLEAILTYLDEMSRPKVARRPRRRPSASHSEEVIRLHRGLVKVITDAHPFCGVGKPGTDGEARDRDVVAALVKHYGGETVRQVIQWLPGGTDKATFWLAQMQSVQGLERKKDGVMKFAKMVNAMRFEPRKKPVAVEEDWADRFEQLEKQLEA